MSCCRLLSLHLFRDTDRNAQQIVSAIRESAREASTFVPMADLGALAGNAMAGVGGSRVGSVGSGGNGGSTTIELVLGAERFEAQLLDSLESLRAQNRLLRAEFA